MAFRTLYFRKDDGSKSNRYFIFDTAAEMLTDTLIVGDLAYAIDVGKFYVAKSTTAWDEI